MKKSDLSQKKTRTSLDRKILHPYNRGVYKCFRKLELVNATLNKIMIALLD